jgi:hypothetical protein
MSSWSCPAGLKKINAAFDCFERESLMANSLKLQVDRLGQDVTLHQDGSNCIQECARGESNSHPFRDWILSPARRSRKGRPSLKLRNHDPARVPTLVPRKSTRSCASFTPELAQIIDSWPSLPPVAKAGVLAIINAARNFKEKITGR